MMKEMDDLKTFFERYHMWKEKAWEEFKASKFYNGEEKYNVELCANGSVFVERPRRRYIKNVITPWWESEFYC